MRRTLTASVAAGALVLGLAACGDDDDEGSDTTTAAAATDAPAPTSAPAGTGAAPPSAAPAGTGAGGAAGTITIEGFAFPAETTAAAGATIMVTNNDNAAHTLTALDGAFNEEVGAGATLELTVPSEPGSYDFVCNFHSGMEGTLVVE